MPYCLKSMIWKTSQAHPPKSNDCYRENCYLPVVLYHHWQEQTRDSPAADSEHTDHLSGKRKPEGSRQIRNESCAKHVSIELLFRTSGPAVLWMCFITWFYWTLLLLAYCFPHITYSSLPSVSASHPSGWKIAQISFPHSTTNSLDASEDQSRHLPWAQVWAPCTPSSTFP